MEIKQHVCDFCGTLLDGMNRKAQIKKPFLSIQGRISLQNEEIGPRQGYIFLSEREVEDYRWCGEECFYSWIEMKRKAFHSRRVGFLREEARNKLANNVDYMADSNRGY